jgi:hypothetical protein
MSLLQQAEMNGAYAAMSLYASREVPPEFAHSANASDAWLEAFDRMRQSLRGCVPAERGEKMPVKPKAEKPKKVTRAVEPQKPKTMSGIFAELHPEAMEYT